MTMLNETPMPRRRGAKRQRQQQVFEILNEHAVSSYRKIDKHRLIVPVDDYQRDESDGRIAADIAMHFDIVAFQALGVIERATGELVVVDGGTRHSAAMKRPDITMVPCLVFSGLTEKQEADAFLRINLNRRRLRTEQQQHAEECSEEEGALLVKQYRQMLKEARVGENCLNALRATVKRNTAAVDTIVRILTQVAVDKHITSRVLKGLVQLEGLLQKEDKTLNRPPVLKKMQARFGTLDAVLIVTVEPRKSGDPITAARAIARTLNIKFPKVTK